MKRKKKKEKKNPKTKQYRKHTHTHKERNKFKLGFDNPRYAMPRKKNITCDFFSNSAIFQIFGFVVS
jgi:hypothetical protein